MSSKGLKAENYRVSLVLNEWLLGWATDKHWLRKGLGESMCDPPFFTEKPTEANLNRQLVFFPLFTLLWMLTDTTHHNQSKEKGKNNTSVPENQLLL